MLLKKKERKKKKVYIINFHTEKLFKEKLLMKIPSLDAMFRRKNKSRKREKSCLLPVLLKFPSYSKFSQNIFHQSFTIRKTRRVINYTELVIFIY